jgi:hypothetical protein
MWKKRDHFFLNLNLFKENIAYNSIPTPIIINDKVRIFYSTRCEHGLNRGTFSDFDLNFDKITNNYNNSILKLGDPGLFDSSGIMPSSVVFHNKKFFMYYIGWNKQVDVPYRLSIGLAISYDGINFKKISNGPLLDRRIDEPYFNTAPCVIIDDNGIWRMWYVSCTGWSLINNIQEPSYRIVHVESTDGVSWSSGPKICIDYDYKLGIESIGRPFVVKVKNKYIMSCSVRKITDYRSNYKNSYKINFYQSNNGIDWSKIDESLEKNITNWDDQMTCYGSLLKVNNKIFCIYNGNGFGKTGFRIAEKEVDII